MPSDPHVIQADDATFDAEVLRADVPVLVDFGATWCGPCKALAPIVAALAAEQAGHLKVVAVDIDDAPAVVQRYGIRSAPTVIVFRAGEKRAQHVGLTTRARLLELLER